MKKEKKRFDWSLRKYLNKSFWTGVFVGIFGVLGSMFIGHLAYYCTTGVDTNGFWYQDEQLGCFLEDYQKTLKTECQNSGDDVDKLLYFNLHRATSRYLKEMARCFDKATEMKSPVDQDRLKKFLDELAREREHRWGKKKI